jgi:zinc transport system substrate-binding protein
MRPSEAAALERADIVFWIGAPLTPWLSDAIGTLAPDARLIGLLETEGTYLLNAKGEEGHDHSHDHGPIDPHAWLDPRNAKVWLAVIADALAESDPENATLYRANRDAALAETDALEAKVADALVPLRDRSFAVYHDALGYLESRFGLASDFALIDSEAEGPSPRRIARLRDLAASRDVTLLFAERGANDALAAAVFEGNDVTVCIIDPLGAELAPGPRLYWDTLTKLSETMNRCSRE